MMKRYLPSISTRPRILPIQFPKPRRYDVQKHNSCHTPSVPTPHVRNMNVKQHNQCHEHPLGILCRCDEYKSIVKRFQFCTISTIPLVFNKFNVEPIASGKVFWMRRRTEKFCNGDQPLIFYCEEKGSKIDESNIDRRWVPVKTDIVSTKLIRTNECYKHQSHMNTQSAETTTLTDMLPHRGRVIKRNDIPWDVGSHKTPPEMTDEFETRWSRATGCFTSWADAYIASTGCPLF